MSHYIAGATLSLTGNTTTGSAVVTGITSTTGVVDGSFFTISKGFASTVTQYKILSHTATTITTDTVATSTETAATVVQQSDCTDKVALKFVTAGETRLEKWLTSVDTELMSLVYEAGLTESDVDMPLNPIVREYLIAYLQYLIFRDNVGSTNTDTPEQEVYRVKLNISAEDCERMRGRCTKAVLQYEDNDDIEPIERVPVGRLFRG